MKEIVMEIEILKLKMSSYTDETVSFGKILYALTNKLERSKLFNMTDEEFIRHIQKIQILES